MANFSPLDFAAIIWFLFIAVFYSWYSEAGPKSHTTLTAYMNRQRESWLRITLQRELRIVDTSIVTGLQNGTAFFASASLLGIGGCFTILRSSNEVFGILKDLPLRVADNQVQWEIKVFGLLLIYAYAFFKFGWSFRLWNYASILIGALPLPEETDKDKTEKALQSALAMNRIAGQHFNRGLRTFFLSIGFIGWFIGPIAFIIATTWIVIVLYRRQFSSDSRLAAEMGMSETPIDGAK